MSVNCQIEIPHLKELGPDLTVGREFFLNCNGEPWPQLTNPWELRLDENDKYALKILRMDPDLTRPDILSRSSDHVTFVVTSYKVGEHHLKYVQIVDPVNSIILGNLDFTVKSVLNPQEPKSEPYGPIGPLSLQLSGWYTFALACFLLSVGLFFGARFYRKYQRRKFMLDIYKHDSALNPYQQLNKKVRSFYRTYQVLNRRPQASDNEIKEEKLDEEIKNCLIELNEAWKVFLSRSLSLPALQWPDPIVVKTISQEHKAMFKLIKEDFLRLIREFKKAIKAVEQKKTDNVRFDDKDLIQLIQWTQKLADKIQNYLKGEFK